MGFYTILGLYYLAGIGGFLYFVKKEGMDISISMKDIQEFGSEMILVTKNHVKGY